MYRQAARSGLREEVGATQKGSDKQQGRLRRALGSPSGLRPAAGSRDDPERTSSPVDMAERLEGVAYCFFSDGVTDVGKRPRQAPPINAAPTWKALAVLQRLKTLPSKERYMSFMSSLCGMALGPRRRRTYSTGDQLKLEAKIA